MTRRPVGPLLAGLALAAALVAPGAVGAAAPTVLRTDGIGPLTLGMDRAAAVRTGWLVHRGKGCPLGGTPPITYRFGGAAPAGLRGGVEFSDGKLVDLAASRGVRTETGVTVGQTPARMAARYRAAGFTVKVTPSRTFGGTFVEVQRDGKPLLGAFSEQRTGRIVQLSVPAVVTCE